jgi:LPPG:FO 2-phospho-L-lactate transferase
LITVLAGGTGSIKIIRGLSVITSKISIIANVGDNFWFQGLYICPDVDTSLYGLKGILDKKRGWGIRNDSFTFVDTLKRLGQENWFKIGDKDLVTHIIRTKLLREGLSLYQVIKKIAKLYDIKHNVIPATDTPIETRIITDKGDINIQEFWVKYKGKPRVYDVYYRKRQYK